MMLKWSQYALLRGAYQAASPSQREKLSDLAKRAEAGDSLCLLELKQFMMELVSKARERAAAAGARGPRL